MHFTRGDCADDLATAALVRDAEMSAKKKSPDGVVVVSGKASGPSITNDKSLGKDYQYDELVEQTTTEEMELDNEYAQLSDIVVYSTRFSFIIFPAQVDGLLEETRK